MGTYRYPTIKTQAVSSRGLGKSDTATLKSLFKNFADYAPSTSDPDAPSRFDEASYRLYALKKLLSGEVTENLQAGDVDRDYGKNASSDKRKPPDLSTVKYVEPGDPASAWVPNPTSPGPGSSNPKDMPPPPEGFGKTVTNSLANDGNSTDATTLSRNPSVSSERMSGGVESRELIDGKSPATANAS